MVGVTEADPTIEGVLGDINEDKTSVNELDDDAVLRNAVVTIGAEAVDVWSDEDVLCRFDDIELRGTDVDNWMDDSTVKSVCDAEEVVGGGVL